MIMNRIGSIVALLSVLATGAWAQNQSNDEYTAFPSPYQEYVTFSVSAHYAVAAPLGGQQTYIDKISPTNFVLQGEWLFPQRFSLGLKTGYQYNQNRLPRGTYQFPSGETISAVQTRTLTTIPALVTASYYFSDNAAAVRPYVQLAGGGAFVDYTNFFGVLSDQSSRFKGAVAPAIGLKFYGRREQGLGAEVQAQYQHVFFNYAELPNSSPSLLISAGITYRWY